MIRLFTKLVRTSTYRGPGHTPLPGGILLLTLLFLFTLPLAPIAHADGGAPNLAYVSGTDQGVSVIDVGQQKVTSTINTSGSPYVIQLSTDARFLYVTQPQQNRVAVIGAKQGNVICTANVPGQPTLLALDTNPNNYTLFAAGNGASSVSAIDPTNCSIKHTYQVNGAVHGLAIAQVGSGLSGSNGSQLWVSDDTSLNIFDDVEQQKIGSIPVPGGPGYISIPPGDTVYVTTRNGTVVAIALNTHQLVTLISGGSYGPMDYDQTTGEIYVPNLNSDGLVVLTPVNPGSPTPHEPERIQHLGAGVQPKSIAITNDGQFGFAALASGDVAMIDIPGRMVLQTIHVGGSPNFIITGLYPPALGNTPQQASIDSVLINIGAYVLVIALFIVPILLFRRYTKAANANKKI